jgi:uncharacterized protein YjbI with pentapeptide repeats
MVFLPRGTYLTSSPLVIDGPVRFVGESCYGTVLKGIGITGYVLSLVGVNFAEVSNLTLHGNDGTTTDLLQFNNAAQSVVRDVLIQNARNGIVLTGPSWSNLCERVIHNGHLTGTGLTFSSCHGAQYTFTGCTFGGSYGFAIAGTASLEAIVFHNCNFEACTVQVGWITGDNVMGVSFNGCNFESTGSPIDIRPLSSGGSVCGLVFQGCTFDGNYTGGTQAYAISLGGASGVVRGFAVIGCYAENFSSWFVRLNGDGQSGIVSGNRLHSMGGSAAVVNTVRSGVLVVNNEIDGVNSGAAWNPPLTTPSYSVSGVTTPTRSYGVGTTNVTQLATVLGTLIADLQAIGLIS